MLGVKANEDLFLPNENADLLIELVHVMWMYNAGSFKNRKKEYNIPKVYNVF